MDVMTYLHSITQWIYPPRCLLCDAEGDSKAGIAVDLCECCYSRFPVNLSACVRCALPLPSDLASSGDLVCGRCQKKPPAFDYSLSLFRYEQPVVWLIKQLKFNERLSHARLLGEMLSEKIEQLLANQVKIHNKRPDCILPVPLHKKRLRERGFNQSIELARTLAQKTGLPLELNLVERVLVTESQTGLDATQRRKNLRGAFKVVSAANYKHVVIVDDVVTTGSTVNELAKVLKRAGIKRVDVWSIARAL
jgi:ComF family protein